MDNLGNYEIRVSVDTNPRTILRTTSRAAFCGQC